MNEGPFALEVLFHLGPIPVTAPVVTTWLLMLALALTCWLGTRNVSVAEPGRWQSALEVLVEVLQSQIEAIVHRDGARLLPLLGTLFIFLAAANLAVVVPGLKPPTAHIETPAALALVVFLSVHVLGVQTQGFGPYLKGYLKPNPVMLPLNVLSELTRTFSLMIRLFGNIMSHEFVVGIVMALAGLFVPVPFMALGILIGLIQAYIFTVLSTVFVGAALGTIERG
jgi:F-type H+-transporting ATPase subunit a